MPVTVVPAAERTLSRQRIRMAMRDVAGEVPNTGVINVLLDNVEFSDDEIDNAIQFAVDWWNSLTPVSNVRAESINPFVLYLGVTCMLLQSETLRQARNQADVGDGDVAPAGGDNKAPLYSQMMEVARQRFEASAKQIKIQQNMEACYGGFGSGYAHVGRLHNGY